MLGCIKKLPQVAFESCWVCSKSIALQNINAKVLFTFRLDYILHKVGKVRDYITLVLA